MNDMNSLILEGNVKEISEQKSKTGDAVCSIAVATRRFYRTSSGEPMEDVAEFNVECNGIVAELAAKQAYHERGIRIVGQLRQREQTTEDGRQRQKVYIFAEHIDYKPDLRKKIKEQEEGK